ncbi:cell division protein [Echinicola jeungdonensis]|uniref:Cell division protein FtsQ/DivIB n=1 Tax=Echinicola jeungdonensis TaxID=709343 RepID=A0ABV5J174_9BACT|nr:cell division protein [Echinicola jeungdonensis]MDN3668402.1 cell division protein [Echinicola jeungdonensis]
MVIKRWKIKQSLVFTLLLLVLVAFIGFVEKKDAERRFHSLEVNVNGISDVYFVEDHEIKNMLEKAFPELTTGKKLDDVQLRKLEMKVESHPFVKNAEVYKDLKGKVRVDIDQFRPVARISRPIAADGYVSSEGLILPTSPHYTSRVLIINGPKADQLLAARDLSEEYGNLLEFIQFIDQQPFWKAQIATIEMDRDGELKLYQQVGKQVIEFGKPTNIKEKFNKINLYYEKIIPQKGWNTYERVNVEFKDQIICE